MSNWLKNKQDAITFNTEPTMTDQSQAEATDINVIVNQFLRTGQSPQGPEPIYADFTELPQDLRGFIEMGRSMGELRKRLPKEFQDMTADKLFSMTTDEINGILTSSRTPKEEPKP